MHYNDYYTMMNGSELVSNLIFFLLIILVIGAIAYVVAKQYKSNSIHKQINTPLDTLKERYVKGEINKEEFDRIKKDIV